PNRRYMEMLLATRFEEYKRVGSLFGILYMDVDLFKNINDDFGHEVGDKVLHMIGQAIKLHSRPYDIVGRWGGDEFLGIIVNVDFSILEKISERYRVLIKETCRETGIGPLEVSISIGSTLVKKNEPVETLLKRADRLLYASKENGRDRVTCS
ncbi:MAG: GGDEF domain-containing protein, partial [Deltaproteobacteria bacterium]|nr:GGDEF domain-containing protein [Deltaproteobacteria bacterium]